MSSVVLSGDSSGTVTLTVPSAAGTNTATLPAATGTVMVSGNMPAFAAQKTSGGQSFSSGVLTKVTFDSEYFDTNNNFASSAFTPTVAGYYQISAGVDMYATGSSMTQSTILITKNGSALYYNYNYGGWAQNNDNSPTISGLVYCNGSTDYIEIYIRATGTSLVTGSGGGSVWVTGAMVRGA